MPKFTSIFDDSITKIKEREQQLKGEISKFSKELQDNVEGERAKVKSRFNHVERQVDETRKKITSLTGDLEMALTSNQGQFIFETTLKEPTLKFDRLPNTVQSFNAVEVASSPIKALFGSFKGIPINASHSEFEFEVLRTFTTDLPVINHVIPLDETTAWVSSISSNKSVIRKVTVQDNTIVTTNEIAMKINDMALLSHNEILMTEFVTSNVKLMTNAGKIKPFITLEPFSPYAIHITSEKRIIVGLIEPGNTFTPTDQSQRAIKVFDSEGKRRQKDQFDVDRQRLFTVPLRITTNNNQDILVIDWTSNKTGRVVTLDREGGLRWIFEGHPTRNSTKQLNPRGIETTATGYVIVSDKSTNTLHVLSENGDVLTCKLMNDIGIRYPLALNMDRGGKLWVGCFTGGKDSGAKLHIVTLII